MKDFNFKHWWTLVAAAGAAIAVASIPAHFVPGFLIGLALLAFGVGEWINRPRETKKETIEGKEWWASIWQTSIPGSRMLLA